MPFANQRLKALLIAKLRLWQCTGLESAKLGNNANGSKRIRRSVVFFDNIRYLMVLLIVVR